ncbi:MAG: oxygenase [Gammaproteobacteria bacterium]|nr:MAG: oxygenase [Gammaproteobacteria bacterium]
MNTLTYEGQEYTCRAEETVLECLTRHGVALPSSCHAGICQTCLMRSYKGKPPEMAQKGLKATLQAQDYFLACICRPQEDMEIGLLPQEQAWKSVEVLEQEAVAADIYRLRLSLPDDFSYEPGQYINVKSPAEAIRSYSLASIKPEDYLELHVKHIPGGKVSTWLCVTLKGGDEISINGPIGSCFYLPPSRPSSPKPILLAGTGTGLAPLYGILRTALQEGHDAPVHLFHGSLAPEGLYLVDELMQLAQEYNQFSYTPCVLKDGQLDLHQVGAIQDLIKASYPSLSGWQIYLCGDPELIKILRMQCFLSGAGMEDIFSDPFEPARA